MKTISYQKFNWIDIVKPSDKDIAFLEKNFPFHHLIVEEIKTPTYHPLIELYDDYMFVILHFPNLNASGEHIHNMEIDFLITKNSLVTVRYENFPDFETMLDAVNRSPASFMNKTTGHLFHHIIKQLLNKTFPELDRIKEATDRIEDRIFERFDEDIIEKIALLKREVIDFLRALKPQRAVWDAAPAVFMKFWGKRLKPYLSDIVADYHRTLHIAETHKEIIDSLHLTFSSLLDNKRNYVIKVLTIFTAIILPLSLVASIYGMNLKFLPLADHPRAFWWFLIGMLAAIVLFLAYFRKRKWL